MRFDIGCNTAVAVLKRRHSGGLKSFLNNVNIAVQLPGESFRIAYLLIVNIAVELSVESFRIVYLLIVPVTLKSVNLKNKLNIFHFPSMDQGTRPREGLNQGNSISQEDYQVC